MYVCMYVCIFRTNAQTISLSYDQFQNHQFSNQIKCTNPSHSKHNYHIPRSCVGCLSYKSRRKTFIQRTHALLADDSASNRQRTSSRAQLQTNLHHIYAPTHTTTHYRYIHTQKAHTHCQMSTTIVYYTEIRQMTVLIGVVHLPSIVITSS